MKLVYLDNKRPITDSLIVAETFGKEHRRVMQDIREMDCSKEFNEHHFVQIDYTDSRNRTYQKYLITQDGFSFLVMGYTGKEAARFKETYINEFNLMKDQLNKPLYVLPQTKIEAMKAYLEEMERNELLEAENAQLQLQNAYQEEKIKVQTPQVALYQMTMAADNTQPIGTIAKTVGMGRNTLFKFLRENKLLMKNSTIPYQQYIDQGLFVVKEVPTQRSDRIEIVATTRVTAKGLDYIAKMVKKIAN